MDLTTGDVGRGPSYRSYWGKKERAREEKIAFTGLRITKCFSMQEPELWYHMSKVSISVTGLSETVDCFVFLQCLVNDTFLIACREWRDGALALLLRFWVLIHRVSAALMHLWVTDMVGTSWRWPSKLSRVCWVTQHFSPASSHEQS